MIYEYYLRQIYKTLRRNYKMDMDKIIKFIFYMRQNYKGNSSSTTYKDKYGRIQKRGNRQRK